MIHFSEKYKKEVIPQMMEKFGYKSPMATPKIQKVLFNVGFGASLGGKTGSDRKKSQEYILTTISAIAGQKATLRQAKKSIATFKLRKGMPVGAAVTLRGRRMFDALERIVWVIMPRTRDFRGIAQKNFDENGNLTIGFKDYISFPEIVIEKEKGIFGLEITIVTSAKTKEEGIALLKFMGFPIAKKDK